MSDKTKTEFNYQQTPRGFGKILFKDRHDQECSIQDSSLATEPAIWLGVESADPKICIPGEGWEPVPFPEGTLFCTRMHLSQEMVRQLLPMLTHFAETGEYLPKVTKTGKVR